MRTTALLILSLAPLALAACDDSNTKIATNDLSTNGDEDMSMGDGTVHDMAVNSSPDLSPVDQIQAVKNAADAGHNPDAGALDLPLADVVVTYLHPLIGTDPAGFFVQEHPAGPAVFIAVDPASLSPSPVVGDTVSFTVTGVTKIGGLRAANALTSWTRSAQGVDVSTLTMDVSAKTDLVTALDSYEGTLIKLTGTINADFASAGALHVSAAALSAGITSGTTMKLRLPAVLQDNIDAVKTCGFTINKVPLWRNNAQAQPSAWVPGDIALTACPAPQVASATALDVNTVRVKFTRNVLPSSFDNTGMQFTIDGGLAVSAPVLSGRFVTMTTTPAQTPGTTYTVTVANTIHDLLDKPLDPAHLTATFKGYVAPAQLVINEVNPSITGGHDLIELRVVSAGDTNNITIRQDFVTSTLLATLPSISVAVDDLIVVHLVPVTSTNETVSKTDCVDASCYAGAWDVNGGASGITFSGRLLTVIAPDGTTYQDVVAFNAGTGSPAGFPSELQGAQAAGQWLPADCTGAPCTYASTPTVEGISVSWQGISNATKSVSRKNPAGTLVQTHSAADWNAPTTPTFGLPNP